MNACSMAKNDFLEKVIFNKGEGDLFTPWGLYRFKADERNILIPLKAHSKVWDNFLQQLNAL